MSRDEAVLAGLVVAFAALVTAHATLLFGLARRAPRWRALAALLLPPLAPWWGRDQRMNVRVAVWTLSAATYAVLLWLAFR